MTESETDEAFVERMLVDFEAFGFDGEDIERMRSLARRGAATQWRPIETAPKDGTRMLLFYRNTLHMNRTVKAFYAPKLAIEQNDDSEGWCEYDETNDRYCLPEGWYECIENWDDYSYIHMSGVSPSHWMPLPPPPALGEPV